MSVKKLFFIITLTFGTLQSRIFDSIVPYDRNMTPFFGMYKKKFSDVISFGFSGEGRNAEGDKVDPTRFLCANQNALAMLKGALSDSEIAAIAQQVNVDDDNGVRGHFLTTGSYNMPFYTLFSCAYQPVHEWSFYAYLPLMHVEMENITWHNQTKNSTADDVLTRALITDDFFANVTRLGNLNLQSWRKTGFGDMTFFGAWNRRFLQQKQWLKEVALTVRAGISFPTGVKKDQDKAFSLAFGNDGAYAFPFGAGIDLRFRHYAWAGIDVSFEHIFSHTKVRRIMTDPAQTNYLFLHTAKTRREYGMIQRFNIYLEPQLWKGFAMRIAYQHAKQSDDFLYVISRDYSQVVANQAQELQEWSTHHIFTQLKWDSSKLYKKAKLQPQVSIFARIPFNGRQVLQNKSVGCSVVIDF